MNAAARTTLQVLCLTVLLGGTTATAGTGIAARYGIGAPADSSAPRTLDDYLALALAGSPRIRAAESALAAGRARAPRAEALPDPSLGLTQFIEPVETRVGPQRRILSLSQALPWFGTLSLRGDVERRESEARAAELAAVELDVLAETTAAYYEIARLEAAIDVTRRHLALLEQWEHAAQARYATGTGGYADLIKAQVELGVLGDRLVELQDRRGPLAAALNALADRPLDAPASAVLPDSLAPPVVDDAALAAALRTQNPRLLAWDHRTERFAAAERLARKAGLPGFRLSLNYIQTDPARTAGVPDSGQDAVSASLAVNLPLWRGGVAAGVREAAEQGHAAAASRREAENVLGAELQSDLFALRDAARKARLYGATLAPKARQSLEAVRAAYTAGDARFLDLIDAERLLLELELSTARALADAGIARARVERLVAAPLADFR
jgi:outer membrane protein TolC